MDAYQSGAIELAELQKRRHLVDTKLSMLQREKELLEKTAAEQRKEADLIASLQQFTTTISSSLNRLSFADKQKLLRIVLDKVVVTGWRVDVHFNIPLPRPTPPPEYQVSSQFDLRPMSICSFFADQLVHFELII